MLKIVWTGFLVVMSLGLTAGPARAQSVEGRRQARIERQERIRLRVERHRELLRQRIGDERLRQLEQRRLRLDRNHDGRLSRAEVARYRAALRRAIRRAYR